METAQERVPIASPSGTFSATVWSHAEGGVGNTQVIVDLPVRGTGAGVFDLDLPHVPLRLRWESDSELVISYPEEVQPRPGDALARQERVRFGDPAVLAKWAERLGGVDPKLERDEYLKILESAEKESQASARIVRIRYEQYAGAGKVIAELRREAQSSPPPEPAANLLGNEYRGSLMAVGQGRYAYDYYDADEKDSIVPTLQRRGYQGGGESWAGIVCGLLKLHAPGLLQQVRFDPEADGLRIWSSSQAALTKVAELVTKARGDPKLLDEAIKAAEADSEME